MIIDSHVHLKHGDADGTEYSPEQIARVMDEAGIAKSVVFAMSTSTQRSIQMALAAREKFPERLIPYAYALPSYERPVLREIEQAITKRSFKGIKVHIGECTLAPYVTDPLMRLAGEMGVPCLIDCGGRYAALEQMAMKFPSTKIIVAHLGRYLCQDAVVIEKFIRLAESHCQIYLDVSGVVLVEKILEAVHRVGADRVLFGTDGPQAKPNLTAFARAEVEKIHGLNLGTDAEQQVLGANISRLLHLK